MDFDIAASLAQTVSTLKQAEASERMIRETESLLRELARRAEASRVLECETDFLKFCARRSGMKFGPFVRAKTYQSVSLGQEFVLGLFDIEDVRRPVVMRGARRLMANKYTTKSAYAEEIAERYLRKIKFTAFHREQTNRMRHKICTHMRRRNIYVHANADIIRSAFFNDKKCSAWIAGEHVWLQPAEWRNHQKNRAAKSAAVKDELRANQIRSDREIGRLVGVDHKTVGAARKSLKPQPEVSGDGSLTLSQKKTIAYRALVGA